MYFIVSVEKTGEVNKLGPIACDNPSSPHGFEDKSILKKATAWAERTKKRFGIDCYVIEERESNNGYSIQ